MINSSNKCTTLTCMHGVHQRCLGCGMHAHYFIKADDTLGCFPSLRKLNQELDLFHKKFPALGRQINAGNFLLSYLVIKIIWNDTHKK